MVRGIKMAIRLLDHVRVGDKGIHVVRLGVGSENNGRVGRYVAVVLLGEFREPVTDLNGVVRLTCNWLLGHGCGGRQQGRQD